TADAVSAWLAPDNIIVPTTTTVAAARRAGAPTNSAVPRRGLEADLLAIRPSPLGDRHREPARGGGRRRLVLHIGQRLRHAVHVVALDGPQPVEDRLTVRGIRNVLGC